eukprot:scaffold2490_cov109-Cylindrotheca_fusiformis.AAC.4
MLCSSSFSTNRPLRGGFVNNSPVICRGIVKFDGRLLEQEDPSPRVDVQQFARFGQNCKFDIQLLEQEVSSRRVIYDNLPDKITSKKFLLQGLTFNNYPNSGKFARYVDDSDLSMGNRSISNCPCTTIHQIRAKSEELMLALYCDGRLLEQEDPSLTVYVQQFTRFGQNHKSKMVHREGSTHNNPSDSGKIKDTSTILTCQCLGTLLTSHGLIIYTSTELMSAL